jgi:hypothetical protein
VRRIGRRHIDSLQLGNEPDLYTVVPWYGLLNGRPVPQYLDEGTPVFSRPPSYGPSEYAAEVDRMLPHLPDLPLSGPDASGPSAGAASWMSAFTRFLHPGGRAVTLTAHAYAAIKCVKDPSSFLYPSVVHLLGLDASRDQLNGLNHYIGVARGRGDGFRVDEMGVVSCSGLGGVANTMASALWVLDTLFSMDAAGVNGVNLHTVKGTDALFIVKRSGGRWHATVAPWYYGALLFTQAAPAGSRLLPVTNATHADSRVWATLGRDHAVRVLAINDSIRSNARVLVRNPPGYGRQSGTVERLRAPSAYATSGVTLGGRGFRRTTTGVAPPPRIQQIRRRGGVYAVTLPAASAALLTLHPGRRRTGAGGEGIPPRRATGRGGRNGVIDYDLELRAHNERLRAAAAVARGDRVLDLGCGTGQSTRDAARAAAPGHVLGIDISASSIERARERTAAARLENATYEHGDAQTHLFAPGSFGLAISRFGAMFFSDPIAAFANVARALRCNGAWCCSSGSSASATRGPWPSTPPSGGRLRPRLPQRCPTRSPSATQPPRNACSTAAASATSSSPTSANPSSTGTTAPPRWSGCAAFRAHARHWRRCPRPMALALSSDFGIRWTSTTPPTTAWCSTRAPG